MTRTINDIITDIRAEFPGWLEGQKEVLYPDDLNDLKNWEKGDDADKLSIGDMTARMAHYELKKFVLDSLEKEQPDLRQLARATRLEIPQFLYAIGVEHLNANSALLFKDYVLTLMQLITIGWKDRAELHARLGLQELMKHNITRGNFTGGALGHGTSSYSYPYMIMDVVQDWLKADKTSTMTIWRDDLYEESYGGYGGWTELIENWREPDQIRFRDILNRAADFHVAESHDLELIGHKRDPDYREVHHEVEEDKYWLYPVLLFTFLRLREWEGLKNPAVLTHDVFQKGIFMSLPPVPDWPEDAFYDAVDARFREMFPKTPTLADLPRLREEQGC